MDQHLFRVVCCVFDVVVFGLLVFFYLRLVISIKVSFLIGTICYLWLCPRQDVFSLVQNDCVDVKSSKTSLGSSVSLQFMESHCSFTD